MLIRFCTFTECLLSNSATPKTRDAIASKKVELSIKVLNCYRMEVGRTPPHACVLEQPRAGRRRPHLPEPVSLNAHVRILKLSTQLELNKDQLFKLDKVGNRLDRLVLLLHRNLEELEVITCFI